MTLFEKLYTLFIFISVLIGFMLGQISGIEHYFVQAIMPLLMLMLYITFLQIPIKEMKKSFLNRRFTFANLSMNFILTPILAWFLATLFLADNPALWIGFIMLMVTPCTDWYIIFTGIAKGNVSLSTSILPLNLIVQLVLLPVDLLVKLILPILAFFFINFIIGRFVGRCLGFSKANTASLNLTTLARNSPIALAIAMTAFPHEPLIAVVLIIGPLIELPLLSIIASVILFLDNKKSV